MDKNTTYFRRLAQEVCESPLPAVPFVGRGESGGAGRFHNPPAEHIEIIYIISGRIRQVEIGDRKVDFLPGRLHLHNVHFGNYSKPYYHCENWCLVLDVHGRDRFLPMKEKPHFESFAVTHPELLVESFSELMLCCNPKDTISTAYFGGPVLFDPRRPEDMILERRLNVTAALLRFFDVLIKDLNSGLDEKTLPGKLLLAQNFITLNYQRPDVSLEDIASSADISTNHLGLLFREYLQTTPMRYLKAYRLGHAKNLIIRTGLSVGEVAQRVGFVDQLHFSREYRRHFGFPPTHTQG